jgi:hypothetical protein
MSLGWLNGNAGAIAILVSVYSAFLTTVYVLLTNKLVRQNQTLREESVKPRISVRAILDPNFFQFYILRIDNVGGGTAQSVQLRVTNPPLGKGLEHLNSNGVFRHGISLLNTRESIEFFLADALTMTDEVRNQQIQITVTFKDMAGARYESFARIDFREVENFIRVGEPPIVTLADSTKTIKGILQSFAGSTKLQVVTSTVRDEERKRNLTNMWARLSRLKRLDPAGYQEVEDLIALRSKPLDAASSPKT